MTNLPWLVTSTVHPELTGQTNLYVSVLRCDDCIDLTLRQPLSGHPDSAVLAGNNHPALRILYRNLLQRLATSLLILDFLAGSLLVFVVFDLYYRLLHA